tara:strand:+ start:3206 stop:4831 length:1626 start_codon:yes stop_codon:yes gene_type:complete
MAITFATLFTRLGKAFFAGNTAITATATSIPAEAEDYLDAIAAGTLEVRNTASGVEAATASIKTAGTAFVSSGVKTPCANLLVQMIKEDVVLPSATTLASTVELISQMETASSSVNASSIGGSVAYNSGNTGDGVIVYSTKRGDGKVNEHILGEVLNGAVSSTLASGQSASSMQGEPAVANTSILWPTGSGASQTLTSYVADSSANLMAGAFETEDSNASNLPSGWIAEVATLGTTVLMTPIEVQTVIISSSPTTGYMILKFTDKDGKQQNTAPLVYNASQSAVQAALRALNGLASVTVVTTGVSPNYTHTITFTDVPNPGQLTSTETFDVGSIAHATSTAGSANIVRGGRAMEFNSNGAEVSAMYYPLTVSAATSYSFNAFFKTDSAPAAGAIKIELLDAIGGSVIADDESTSNLLDVDATALTTSWSMHNTTFRTPTVLPGNVYLRVRISTAITNTSSVFFDELCFVPSIALYTGGPMVAMFTGETDWVVGDKVTITPTNDRGGTIHEWSNRVFDLRTNNLLLPSNSAGGETIADSLIS